MKVIGADHLDKSFINMLREIERIYAALSKPLRIRVERWVSKLNSVGRAFEWRKNRNKYTKLLLNMIIVKQFTTPFDVSPSDEPLPPLPLHIVNKSFKDLMGTHESVFWRDVYEHIEGSINSDKDFNMIPIKSSDISMSISPRRCNEDPFYMTEIKRLNDVITSQQERIKQLESQIMSISHNHFQSQPKHISAQTDSNMSNCFSNEDISYSRSYDDSNVVSRSYNSIKNSRSFDGSYYSENSPKDSDKWSIEHTQSVKHHTQPPPMYRYSVPIDDSLNLSYSPYDSVIPNEATRTILSGPSSVKRNSGSDDEFLSYIRSFQQELKQLHADEDGYYESTRRK